MRALAAHFLVLIYCMTVSSVKLKNGQNQVIDTNEPDDYEVVPGEQCNRKCTGKNYACRFTFVIESFTSLSPACGKCPNVTADCFQPNCVFLHGVEKPILTINRMMPGPEIHVCKNDKLIVVVKNKMIDKVVAIHWHGIEQRGTPYMDGAPMITQCPIHPGQTFVYVFYTPLVGSYFYHSHDGFQKEDGIQGPLIVRDIEGQDHHSHLYTHDHSSHYIFVSDMFLQSANTRFPGTIRTNVGQGPQFFLINGRGIQATVPPLTLTPGQTPMTEYTIRRGGKYRFRIISALCLTCPVEISIQSHKMTLITTDGGNPIEPRVVTSISITAAERYDVVLHANQETGTYWITATGLGACTGRINQFALLKYEGSTQDLPLTNTNNIEGPTLKFLPNQCNESNPEVLCITQLKGVVKPSSQLLENKVKRNFIFNLGFHNYIAPDPFFVGSHLPYFILGVNPASGPLIFKGVINNITYSRPSSGPTLLHPIPKDELCPRKCKIGYGDSRNCNCANLNKVPFGATVFFIVADTALARPNGIVHPFHLHGFTFFVVETGVFKKDRETSLKEIEERLNNEGIDNPSPVLKDVVGVPSGGYIVIAFLADNPGFWLFHCHFIFHSESGMTAILQVGERHQMPHPPPNFPTCHSYKPSLEY